MVVINRLHQSSVDGPGVGLTQLDQASPKQCLVVRIYKHACGLWRDTDHS